jgi:hypothetical protein
LGNKKYTIYLQVARILNAISVLRNPSKMKVEEEEKLGVRDWIFFLGSDTKGSVECVFFRSDVRVRVNPNVECSCGMWINRKLHIAKCNRV